MNEIKTRTGLHITQAYIDGYHKHTIWAYRRERRLLRAERLLEPKPESKQSELDKEMRLKIGLEYT